MTANAADPTPQPDPWAASLETLTDLPELFAATASRSVHPAAELAVEPVIRRNVDRRRFADLRARDAAIEQIAPLPSAGESVHLVLGQRMTAWSLVPALIALARPARCASLHIATLSFNESNTDALFRLIDAGDIGRVTFLSSCYHRAGDAQAFATLERGLMARHCRIAAVRNHAKILAFDFGGIGGKLVVETSANLRSNRNLETATLANDAALYSFHVGWIDELAAGGHRR